MKWHVAISAWLVCAAVLVGGCESQTVDAGVGERLYTYTVQQGDTSYGQIADKVYGDETLAETIAKANPDVEAGNLQTGQELTIPAIYGMGEPKGCDRKDVY